MIKEKFREELTKVAAFEQKVKKNMATALLAAFAFVMALVWRDAIQSFIADLLSYFNITEVSSKYNLITALLTTIICVLGIIYFSKWSEKK